MHTLDPELFELLAIAKCEAQELDELFGDERMQCVRETLDKIERALLAEGMCGGTLKVRTTNQRFE